MNGEPYRLPHLINKIFIRLDLGILKIVAVRLIEGFKASFMPKKTMNKLSLDFQGTVPEPVYLGWNSWFT